MTERYVEDLIEGLLERFNPLEISIIETLNKWDLTNATGLEVDHIASVFGLKRFGASDEVLKRRIRAIVAINNCSGSISGIIQSLKVMFNAQRVVLHNHGMGCFTIELEGTDIDIPMIEFVNQVPAAGTKITEIYFVTAATFRHDDPERGLDIGELG